MDAGDHRFTRGDKIDYPAEEWKEGDVKKMTMVTLNAGEVECKREDMGMKENWKIGWEKGNVSEEGNK
jgi:hypothetical protein